jgi:threonine/homoserine/homoserine lactone efflux protein
MFMVMVVKGIVIGVLIAAPVGPIGLLCIRRTLLDSRLHGVVTGMGAASADALYGCVAGFGLTLVSNALLDYQQWLKFFGGLFLCYLGLQTLWSRPDEGSATTSGAGWLNTYATTFLLTLSNPVTVLSFAAIFAALGASTQPNTFAAATALVGGVFIGSMLWWILLTGVVGLLRRRMTLRYLRVINGVSGAIMLGFGFLALLSMR